MDDFSQLRRHGLFDARVPRYTSYPTAPHFGNSVGAAEAGRWLSAVRPGEAISLYVHIPFCRRLCYFCACRTQGTATGEPLRPYLESVKAELAEVGRRLPEGVRIAHLHLGGGTPTLLPAEMLGELAAAIRTLAPLDPKADFSVEIDPNELDDARLDALAAAGMTRASIGVQDFDEEIQKTIGRPQSFATTRAAVDGLRACGILSLNMDILYGLPFQTPARIAASVQQVLSLSPDRVALFGYAHVPWVARRQKVIPTDALPAPEERLRLFETARQLFVWDGFAEIGIDHFARPGDGLALAARVGRLRRNFQGYTADACETLIGVGASSISRFREGYVQNEPSTSTYHKAVRAGRLPAVRGHAFRGDDLLRGGLIEALMCHFAADLAAVAEAAGAPVAAARSLVDAVACDLPEALVRRGDMVTIPRAARPLARIIASRFDAYHTQGAGHSHAV